MFIINELDRNFSSDFDNFLNHKRQEEKDVSTVVKGIIEDIRLRKDDALRDYTARFDGFTLENIAFEQAEIDQACQKISAEEKAALELAASRIRAYHKYQIPKLEEDHHDESGARLGWRWSAIGSVGIYVPGGLASYPSSVLMNAIPAKVAGVPKIYMAVPTPKGEINPLVLYAAKLVGVSKIFKMGGAQAIGALAYGTQSVPHVDMITGPGNIYVAEAKRQVFGHVGIDMIAGPSEVLIIADKENDPDWIAVDLLSQAEHDQDAQAILITTDASFALQVQKAIESRLKVLKRREIATKSWQNHGAIIVSKSLESAAHIANIIAPEHLQICTKNARALSHLTHNAGAIFLGQLTPEAIGDYVGGPNHVLPTSRSARFSSGLNVMSFMKRTTVSEMTSRALSQIGHAAVTLANSENLEAHGLSVSLRLAKIEGDKK